MPAIDPDAALVAVFENYSIKNNAKSVAAGREVHDDIEIVRVRYPGSRDVKVFPATAFSDWVVDPYTGEQRSRTYAERFSHQYRQFRQHVAQTKQGTPLDTVPFLTAARKAELRALNLYTAEALAVLDGAELKNLGPGGRELKHQAIEYLAQSAQGAPSLQMAAELEATRAREQALLEDNKAMATKLAQATTRSQSQADETGERSGDEMFDAMSDLQLKEYITAQTGQRPLGQPKRPSLLRMAMECRSEQAA